MADLAGLNVDAADFLAAVLEAAGQPIWVVDPGDLIRFANPAALAALGYDDAEELSGRHSHETIHYQYPDGTPYPAADCPMLLPRATGEVVESDLDWFFRRDGSMFPVSYVSVPVEMPTGRGAVVAFTDIEDRLRAEQVLREHDAVLETQQASLQRVATLVATGATSADVFAAIAEEVAQVLGLPIVVIWRYEPDGTVSVVANWSDRPHGFQTGSRWPLDGPSLPALVKRTGRPARLDDYADVRSTIGDAVRESGMSSGAAAPIVVDGTVWGSITTGQTDREPLPDHIEERLADFTELVATAISNSASREELAQLADEQATLRRVATLVARGIRPAELFSAVSEEVGRLFGTDAAAVVKFEQDGSALFVVGVAKSIEEGLPIGSRFPLNDALASTKVFRKGRSARVDHRELATVGEPVAAVLRRVGVVATVASPIRVEGGLWGAMTVSSSDEPLPPDTEQRLEKFTELVATAVANADSREALGRLADEQAALRRVATLVADEAAPDVIFASVAEEVARFLNGDRCAVGRYEPDDSMTVVAYWSSEEPKVPVGTRIGLEGDDVTAAVRESRRPIRIDDHEGFSGPLIDYARTLGPLPVSTVAAPIFVEGRVWGSIFASTMTVEISDGTESRVMDFAELVASSIANADSREALARLADEQAALRRMATLVAQGVPPAEIFSAVSAEVSRLFSAHGTTVDLATAVRFDPGPEVVLVGASKTIEGLPLQARWEPIDLYVSSRVLRTGRSARIDESEIDSVGGPVAESVRRMDCHSQVGSPIIVEGELWGAMTMNAKEALPPDSEERLDKFTELLGTAIANAESRSELAASRLRIVAASDEARRRIERDLHDGVQQRLVSLRLELQELEAAMPANDELQSQVARVTNRLDGALEELVEIARGIHPAILSQGGLRPALKGLARRSGVPVLLDAEIESLPEQVAVAAYYVVSEALTNAAKHARASVVHVDVVAQNGTLWLSVRDDGVGGADPRQGSGLVGLQDRVEALGGKLKVESAPGSGTSLGVTLPLEEPMLR